MPRRRFVNRKRRYHPRWVKKSANARGYTPYSVEKPSGIFDSFKRGLVRKSADIGSYIEYPPPKTDWGRRWVFNFENIGLGLANSAGSMLRSYVDGKLYHLFASQLDQLGGRRRFDRARFTQAFGEVRAHLPPDVSDEQAAAMLAGLMDEEKGDPDGENPYSSIPGY